MNDPLSKIYWPDAYQAGYTQAKQGGHIANNYPYLKPSREYWAWVDGYNDYLKENKTICTQ